VGQTGAPPPRRSNPHPHVSAFELHSHLKIENSESRAKSLGVCASALLIELKSLFQGERQNKQRYGWGGLGGDKGGGRNNISQTKEPKQLQQRHLLRVFVPAFESKLRNNCRVTHTPLPLPLFYSYVY